MGDLSKEELTGLVVSSWTWAGGRRWAWVGDGESGDQMHRLDIFTGSRYLLGDAVIKIPKGCHQTRQGDERRKGIDEVFLAGRQL